MVAVLAYCTASRREACLEDRGSPRRWDWCFRVFVFFLAEESSFLQAEFVGSITMEAL